MTDGPQPESSVNAPGVPRQTLKPTELHPPVGRSLEQVLACRTVTADREVRRTVRGLTIAIVIGLLAWAGLILGLLELVGAL